MTTVSLTKNRSYMALMTGQFFSTFGSWVDLLAMLYLTGFVRWVSPMEIGYVIMCFSGSLALFSALGGGMASKMNPKAMIVISAVARFGLMLLYPLTTSLWQVCLLIVVKGFFIGIFNPVKDVQMKRIVPKSQFERADHISNRIEETCKFVGPAGAILLLLIVGYENSYALAGAIYFASCIPLLFMQKDWVPASEYDEEEAQINFKEGASYLHKLPVLLVGLIIMAFTAVCVTVGDSQMVILFRDQPNATVAVIACVVAASGLGTLIINVLWGKKMFETPLLWFTGSSILIGLIIAGAGYLASVQAELWMFVAIFFLGGIGWQLVFVPFQNEILRRVPKPLDMSAFAYAGVVIILCYSTGPMIGGALVTWLGISPALIWSGLILSGIGLCFLVTKQMIESKYKVQLQKLNSGQISQ